MNISIPNWLIIIGGVGQIFTALIYPYIRHRIFDWYKDIEKLKPLNQEIAKTYGWYIQGLNFFFGLMAITLTEELRTPSALAFAITSLIAVYWVGKVATQIAYYPMYDIPKVTLFTVGSYGMNALFLLFAIVFILLALHNSYYLFS
ncbi:hypothetical protein [Aquimarina brevivitae]|uniref:Uncharacterized protein n=1 Tax=Aquimarina brevivitae TaxID=323412 RepID=A0A4Q7PI73_9FLAO|nr:hypothetical protein [Aquimarina brevivitae]RZS99917.1 hypothetical protein EV197_1148 [Aquimarina brevivitae]